ncbi:UDP-N-acetylglucosamine 2-epimerase [Desulfovibrio ferrophilus]|uniref:UDP-N-acetylglucosamine 2-epimerase n=1 Tax=Desulfovibrio ferrophilus TaxID=241368 RepID=A0A2Z6B1J5_9BACT|nr:UDP-N-acetylglucosamine 2-epimerase [Desulfovibrio ferrophilus]BBD09328.1 UDP-N-acetylglucosamine 2-epimerase [Desulfovibrio ferrophilus]
MASKVCVFTGSRSDFDRLYWICLEIQKTEGLELQLIAGNMHLSPEYGLTINAIRETGLHVDAEVDMLVSSATSVGTAKTVGLGTLSLAETFNRLQPDIILVLGDRFELLSVASACTCMTIPMAHIGGGQTTEGAMDEQIRHMVTKASHLHFVANEMFGQRLKNMGEEVWRVFITGSPSIDSLMRTPKITTEDLSKELGLDLARPTALVAYHPATLDPLNLEAHTNQFIEALSQFEGQLVLTYPNGDPGSEYIIKSFQKLDAAHGDRSVLIPTLGITRFVSALLHVDFMIGNSSSALIEAPTFNLPAVNVGDRQKGRLASSNVISCAQDSASILRAMQEAMALGKSPCGKPYGDGKASPSIVSALKSTLEKRTRQQLLTKKFSIPGEDK